MEVAKQTGLVMRSFRTPTASVQGDQVDGARYLLPPGSPVSVITEIYRTIERRFIRTLHFGKRNILKFRTDNLVGEGSASVASTPAMRVREDQPELAAATNGRDDKPFEAHVSRCTMPPSPEKVARMPSVRKSHIVCR
jgi:hypothetical protein